MEKKPEIDPLVYDESTWPKLNKEEKFKAAVQTSGLLIRIFGDVMRDYLGDQKAKELGTEVWKRLVVYMEEKSSEMLGIKNRQDAISYIKMNAYFEEEQLEAMASTLEASPEKATRALVRCPWGEIITREDCAYMMEGGKAFVEEHYPPGYTVSVLSCYHDNHICSYKIHKIKD